MRLRADDVGTNAILFAIVIASVYTLKIYNVHKYYYGFWLHELNHFLTKAIVPKLSLLLMFTLLNKVKKRDWNYAATEVYINKRRFRKRIKHTCWFTYISLHLYHCLYLFIYGSNTWLFWELFLVKMNVKNK